MGIVYRARDTRLNRAVAIKLVSARRMRDTRARKRLLREARAAAALTHANVVQVHDVVELEDGGAFVVMELVQGRTLAQLTRETRVSLEEVLRWISEAASAIDAAHAIGIVHRDVKPDTMMVRRDGRLALLDFGIVKHADGEGESLTKDDLIVGTPAYMSPEQAQGLEAGPESDEWSLAIVAYELLTGRSPWVAGALLPTLHEIVTAPHPPPTSVSKLLPSALDAVFARALAKAPNERFSSASELASTIVDACRSIDAEAFATAQSPMRASSAVHRIESAATLQIGAPTDDEAAATQRDGTDTLGDDLTTSAMRREMLTETRSESQSESQTRTQSDSTRTLGADPDEEETQVRQRPRPRWKSLIFSAIVIAAIAMAAPKIRRWRSAQTAVAATSASIVASPFADPEARVGCVPLVGRNLDPSLVGWYGAAASHAICTRIVWFRGATTAHQRLPAQLLHVPTAAIDDFPDDPFGDVGARDRALASAKKETNIYLDGEVERLDDGVRIVADLRSSSDDRALGHAEARDDTMEHAATKLVFAWVDEGALPVLPMRPSALVANDDPRVAALATTFTFNPQESRAQICPSVRAIDPKLAHAGPFLRTTCDPSAGALTLDRATPTRFVDSLLGLDRTPTRPSPTSVIPELQALVDKAQPGDERAYVRGVLGRTMHHAGDVSGGCTMIRAGVSEAPTIEPLWLQLAELCEATPALERAIGAWAPDALQTFDRRLNPTAERALRLERRRYALAPTNAEHGVDLVRVLTRLGRIDDAGAVIAALTRNPTASPMARLFSQSLLDIARGRVSAAHDALVTALLAQTTLEDAANQLASITAIYCASILGKTEETADRLVRHFDTSAGLAPQDSRDQIASLSMFASPAVARQLVADRAPLSAGDDADVAITVRVAQTRGERDAVGFRRALRESLSEWQASTANALLLDEIGDDEFGARVDASMLALTPKEVAGISMALPRMARRAMRQGHRDEAKKLAQQVIDAWSLLDAPSPQVAEMRAIVAGTWVWKAPW